MGVMFVDVFRWKERSLWGGVQSVLFGHGEDTKKWGKLEMQTCQFVITEIFNSKFEGI